MLSEILLFKNDFVSAFRFFLLYYIFNDSRFIEHFFFYKQT